jgi:hypothetical protein
MVEARGSPFENRLSKPYRYTNPFGALGIPTKIIHTVNTNRI